MKIKKSFVIFWCLATLLMMVPFAHTSGAQEIVLKAASSMPEGHRVTQDVYLPYMHEIEKRTNGRVKFKFYPASTLFNARQSREGVTAGMADIAFPMSIWAFEDQYPVTRVLGFPFVVDSSLQGSYTFYKMFQEIPEVRKEFSDVKVIGFHCTGAANLGVTGKKVPKTLDEIKGLRVWAGSKKSISVAELLGMVPRRIKLEDLYMSLQRGSVDGALFAMAPARGYKLVEVISNWMVMNAYVSPQPMVMNLKTWQSLPPDIQKVFDDLVLSYSGLAGTTVDNESDWVTNELKARGDNIYFMTDEQRKRAREITQPMFDEWIKEVGKIGVDGKSVLQKTEALAADVLKHPYPPDAWWGRAGKKE